METDGRARLFTIRATDRGNTIAVLAGVAFAVLLMVVSALSIPAYAAPTPATAAAKFYVVGAPVDSQREFLFAIAAQTLGDGKRYREIFDLTRGRPQPDGRVMSDPTVVEPGWILLLPDDARGPGVRTGPLPSVAPPSDSPSAAATTSATAEARPETDESGLSPSLLATLAALLLAALAVPLLLRRGRRVPARAGPASDATGGRRATRTDAAATVTPPAATVTARLPLLPEPPTTETTPGPPVTTRPSAAPAPFRPPALAGPDVPPPTAEPTAVPIVSGPRRQPPTPEPTASPAAREPAIPATAPPVDRQPAAPLPVAPAEQRPAAEREPSVPQPVQPQPGVRPQPAPTQPTPPPTPATSLVSPQSVSPPPVTAPRPVTPLTPATAPKRVSAPLAAALPAPRPAADDLPAPTARLVPVESSETPAEPAPDGDRISVEPTAETPAPAVSGLRRAIALPTGDLQRVAGIGSLAATAPGWFPPLVTDLDADAAPMKVRLVGARPARWGSAYGWLEEDWRPPPSTVPVVLGEHNGRRLWVDLAAAPDVLSLGGDENACQRLGVRLLAQLAPTVDVVVVGDALGDEPLPPGCHRLNSVNELAGLDARALRVVFCPGASAGRLWRERRSLATSAHRTIPVVVGEAPQARWSVHAMAEGSAR